MTTKSGIRGIKSIKENKAKETPYDLSRGKYRKNENTKDSK